MGKIFTLDADVKSIIRDAIDDLILELGKVCRLVYPPKMIVCANCVSSPIGNKPSNRWKHGGPIQFPMGSLCPMCDGEGYKASEASEDIKFLLEWDSKRFEEPLPNVDVRLPFSVCQIKGYLTDMPKLKRADHIILQVSIMGLITARFRLIHEPGDRSNIIQGRYFVAVLERIA